MAVKTEREPKVTTMINCNRISSPVHVLHWHQQQQLLSFVSVQMLVTVALLDAAYLLAVCPIQQTSLDTYAYPYARCCLKFVPKHGRL